MNKLTMVPLDLIQPNPWQPRQQEDAEHIKALALSIATDGLLQVPVGREVDGKIELAFGHSRLAAYKWLRDVQPNSNIPGDWSTMPVMVRDISDEEMFRLAVSENVQRRDLSPIEEARAMQRYRDEFGKTSKEIGELFGMAESTVRNKMRLVELPEAAQKVLEEGSITENGARRLLSVQKILPAEKVSELAVKIAEGDYSKPEQVDETILYSVNESKNTQRLHYRWATEKRANDLWPLEWDASKFYFPEITFAQFRKSYAGPETVMIGHPTLQPGIPDGKREFDLKEIFQYVYLFIVDEQKKQASSTTTRRIAEAAPEAVEVVRHLASPPPCSKCPFYLLLAGDGFCGRKACFERKKELWLAVELGRVSDEMDIQIYDPAVDGKYFVEYQSWGTIGEWFRKALQEKAAHLRVRNSKNYYNNNLTKSNVVEVISVETERVRQVRAEYEAREKSELIHASQDAEREERQKRVQESRIYMEKLAGPVFGGYLFGHLSKGALRLLARARRVLGDNPETRPELLAALGSDLLFSVIDWDTRALGTEGVQKHLIGLAKEIGMPAERLSVSVETEVEHEN